jgi:hypothetical protein
MLGAVLLTLGLQLAVIYVPFLQEIFITVPPHRHSVVYEKWG